MRRKEISIHAPTRGATDPENITLCHVGNISIHAPTRGATGSSIYITRYPCISIHAPTRGATKKITGGDLIMQFQSTLPRGERQQQDQCHSRNCNFNPRSHEGSDLAHALSGCEVDISIHAPTRGATIPECMTATTQMHFNPRSHEGSDANARERARRQNISIHAPTRGATIKKLPKRDQSSDFNPRSHEGSDIEGGVGVGVTSDFNPRSHEGSDLALS